VGRVNRFPLHERIVSAKLLLDRIAASPLFAKRETSLHKARFAKPFELEPLLGNSSAGDPSLILGVGPYGRFLRIRPTATRREIGNVLVDAPTRRGKGLLAVSQLLSWPHSAIVNDIKGELFELTAGYRSRLGPVFVIDPRGVGHRFDPLRNCRDEDDSRAMAVHLLHKSRQADPDPFTKRAVKMLTAIFQAGLLEGQPLLPYAAYLLHSGPEAAAERLERLSRHFHLPEHENLATRFLDRKLADADFSDRYLQSSWSTLTGDMDPVITDKVIRSVAGADVSPEDVLCGRRALVAGREVWQPVTVYLRFPEHRLHALSPLVRLIWSSLLDELIALYDSRRGQACNPVLALIDEAGTSPIPAIPRYAATVAGRGISLVVLVQDHNQLEAAYGRHGAVSLINNMETQLYYGQSGLDTSEYIEKRMGRKSEYARSKTTHGSEETAEGESEQAVPLMTVQDITELSEIQIIGIHRNLKPFRAQRMDWRDYPHLLARTKIPPPELSALPPVSEISALPTETAVFDLDG
jgi:type IV secretion system protein VirD4